MDTSDLLAAVKNRHSVRKYSDRVIPEPIRAQLDVMASSSNAESGLSMKVVYDDPEAFRGGASLYGRLEGVRNYIILSGVGDSSEQDHGYYGQKLVLLAQHLGLNTCWTGLTFNKKKVQVQLDAGEKLSLVIALGYGLDSGKPHKLRPLAKLGSVFGGEPMPDWFVEGLEAVALAPSARHQQKYSFELKGDQVIPHQGGSLTGYTGVDLGIAKLHFEIGAKAGTWNWGLSEEQIGVLYQRRYRGRRSLLWAL
ncbi:MAG: hypothetical protein FWG47_05825 [Propionibacteriaceae bacterium]|nr:hypothetical protein [Propionibacteriaceae bacterium]